MGADPIVRGLYDPQSGEVACVLINAAFGFDNRATNAFDAGDWFTAPRDTMVAVEAPLTQWRAVAAMPKDERVSRLAARFSKIPSAEEQSPPAARAEGPASLNGDSGRPS
jgi:hypothetical protein